MCLNYFDRDNLYLYNPLWHQSFNSENVFITRGFPKQHKSDIFVQKMHSKGF